MIFYLIYAFLKYFIAIIFVNLKNHYFFAKNLIYYETNLFIISIIFCYSN